MSTKGSDAIRQNRPPRVHISYKDPIDAEKNVELPFVMGVMSDLSGNAPGKEKPEVVDRQFEKVTGATLDSYMREKVKPGLSIAVENKLDTVEGSKLGVNLRFDSMKDFEPAEIAKQVPALNKLLESRQQLADLMVYLISKPEAQSQVLELLNDPDKLKVLAEQAREEMKPEPADAPAADAE